MDEIFIFIPVFPLGVAGQQSWEDWKYLNSQQLSQIFLLPPHQDGTKQGGGMQSLHLVLGRPLDCCPVGVGVASKPRLANLS